MGEGYATRLKNGMTIISKQTFEKAAYELDSPEQVADFLRNELIQRNVRTNLIKFTDGQDIELIQKKLNEGIMENHPDKIKEHEERRIRNWINGDSVPTISKKDAIEVAFILQMDLQKADAFVAQIAEEKFHWRDVEEIVYIYGLKNKLSYNECARILNKPEIQAVMDKVTKGQTKVTDGQTEDKPEYVRTEFIKKKVEAINTEEGLIEYLKENCSKLGKYHNTAYELFMQMIDDLQQPELIYDKFNIAQDYSEPQKEEPQPEGQPKKKKKKKKKKPIKYSMRSILKDYLYAEIVLDARARAVKAKKEAKKQGQSEEEVYTLDLIQKAIADSWPEETIISKMRKREKDVTRKALILLFWATGGEYDYDMEYDKNSSEMNEFEEMLSGVNEMLVLCGFSELDPRNPFDCMLIYCMSEPDISEMDEKMLEMLEELFPE